MRWEGRLQLLWDKPDDPRLLIDGAHNVDAAGKLARTLLEDFTYDKLWLIYGAPADKGTGDVLSQLCPLSALTITTSADHPRAAAPEELAAQALRLGFPAVAEPNIGRAVERAFALAGARDLICVTGSIILLGELLNKWDDMRDTLFVSDARPH